MIEIKNVHKKFGKQEVLKGVSTTLEPNKIYAVLGPNGSGKTTLIKSILGMVLMDQGKITVDGEDITKGAIYRKKIDYLPQIANFPANLSVKELIAMIKNVRCEKPNEEELLHLFGLHPYLNKKLSNLSGGTKQKVNLLFAFMFNSPNLILDEPTSGLDPIALLSLKDLIRKSKDEHKLILITSHIISFVEEMADEIIFLLEGVIYYQGTKAGLLEKTNEDTLEKAIAKLLKMNRDKLEETHA